MRPVSQEEYDERTDIDNLTDRYEEVWRDMVSAKKTELGLVDWMQYVVDNDGVEETAFDTSYWRSAMWDQIREKDPEITEEDYPVIECTGGGRCFSVTDQWDELYEPELWDIIKQYETK